MPVHSTSLMILAVPDVTIAKVAMPNDDQARVAAGHDTAPLLIQPRHCEPPTSGP